MVECVRPEPMRTIADPACGTGGFFLTVDDFSRAFSSRNSCNWLHGDKVINRRCSKLKKCVVMTQIILPHPLKIYLLLSILHLNLLDFLLAKTVMILFFSLHDQL
jgi:hypothetical protein